MLCGIVLSRLTQRAQTLIIAGLCIERGLKGCQNRGGGGVWKEVWGPSVKVLDGLQMADGEKHLP